MAFAQQMNDSGNYWHSCCLSRKLVSQNSLVDLNSHMYNISQASEVDIARRALALREGLQELVTYALLIYQPSGTLLLWITIPS